MSDYTLTPFEQITSSIPALSAWQALWNEAEELLLATRPDGFEVEEIGRLAFEALPAAEREEALDCLFYTFWAATLADRETRARIEQDGGAS